MDEEFIERLSSIFISIPEKDYGTRYSLFSFDFHLLLRFVSDVLPFHCFCRRTHTIILVTQDNHMDFNEYTMSEPTDSKNPEWIHSHFAAKLEI